MDTLPKDMLLELLSKVDDSDLVNLCKVEKKFYHICKDDEFWKNRGLKTFGPQFLQLHNELKESYYKNTYKVASDLAFLKTWLYQLKYRVEEKNIMDLFHVRKLHLGNNQLVEVPKQIGHLRNLEELELYDNQLIQLPKEIGYLRNLKILTLDDNKLTQLPKEIAHLQNLQVLSSSRNQLTSLPKELGELQNLEYIWLNKNNQLHSIPKELAQLQNLKVLRVSRGQLTHIPKELEDRIRIIS